MSEKATYLVDRGRIDIKIGPYGTAPATALADPSLHPRVQDYRRQTGSRMAPLDREEIHRKLPTADYLVSKKIDGEFTVLVWRDGEACTLNPGGTVRVGLPLLAEAARTLERAQVTEALIVGELHLLRADGKRARVHDVTHVLRQPGSVAELDRLAFAVFDIMSLDSMPAGASYEETWRKIEQLFGEGELVRAVEMRRAKASADVGRIFKEWVEQLGAEGLVARSDAGGLFKIKPRHTLDVAVIGFTESSDDRQGMLHDLLIGVMRADGALHVLGRVGGGFTDDQRRSMLADLKDQVAESEYAEVNSDHVAYQMVRPEWVIEISCLDLVAETTRGGPVNRMVLSWDAGEGKYCVVRRLPLAAVISPQFVRRREDKQVVPFDVRIQQISEITPVPLVDRDARELTMAKSQLLRREVYTKELKGETMVRKFVMWKTNKEGDAEEFPAYVAHSTDYSPNRKIQLAREVRISSSEEQITQLYEELKAANVKKGWELHSDSASEPAPQVATPAAAAPETEPAPARKKPAARRKKKA